MNRAFAVILIPALLVAIGYLVVFRSMGVSPAYWRLILPVALLGAAFAWLGWRTARKTDSGGN
jgi:ABC-type glycerol-3-phosphate transport system permease component